jgi:hypothetical protein
VDLPIRRLHLRLNFVPVEGTSMRGTMRAALAMAAAVVAAAAAVVTAPGRTFADTTLPLAGFGDLVVDGAHQHVLVSGGATGNEIAVTDLSGRVVKTIGGQFGASGLALSQDGRTAFVALAAGDAISAIDTATLAERARYATGPGTCPTHLAGAGSRLWFGYGCDSSTGGGIGLLDTTADPPAVRLGQQGPARFVGAPLLVTAPGAPASLIAGQLGLSPASVEVYSVSADGSLALGASSTAPGDNLADVAETPDGATLFTAAASPDYVQGLAVADFSRRGVFDTGPFPDATAVSADGRYLAAGARTSGTDVLVFRIADARLVRSVDFRTGDLQTLLPRGLAWAPDGRRLFAVTGDSVDRPPALRVISRPTG